VLSQILNVLSNLDLLPDNKYGNFANGPTIKAFLTNLTVKDYY